MEQSKTTYIYAASDRVLELTQRLAPRSTLDPFEFPAMDRMPGKWNMPGKWGPRLPFRPYRDLRPEWLPEDLPFFGGDGTLDDWCTAEPCAVPGSTPDEPSDCYCPQLVYTWMRIVRKLRASMLSRRGTISMLTSHERSVLKVSVASSSK